MSGPTPDAPPAPPGRFVTDVLGLRAHFKERGDQIWVMPHGLSVSRLIEGRRSLTSVEISWHVSFGSLLFVIGMPFHIPAAHLPAAAQAICAVNARLPLMGFQLRGDGMTFTASAFLDHEGAISTRVLDTMCDLAFAIDGDYQDFLAAACAGKPLPPWPVPRPLTAR